MLGPGFSCRIKTIRPLLSRGLAWFRFYSPRPAAEKSPREPGNCSCGSGKLGPHPGEFSTSAGKSRGVSVPFPAAARKPFRVPFCYQGRAVPAGSSEVDRGEVRHPDGRRRALAGPGSGSAPLTLALVVGRHLVAVFILLPPSGAPWRDVAAVQAGEFPEAGGTVRLIPFAPGPWRLIRSPETVPAGSWRVTVATTPSQSVGPPGGVHPPGPSRCPSARGSRLGPPRGKECPLPGNWPCSAGSPEEGGHKRSAVGRASAQVFLSLHPETRTDGPAWGRPAPTGSATMPGGSTRWPPGVVTMGWCWGARTPP